MYNVLIDFFSIIIYFYFQSCSCFLFETTGVGSACVLYKKTNKLSAAPAANSLGTLQYY